MRATRVRGTYVPAGHYVCSRCGIFNQFKVSRANKPTLCGDCNSVERLMARTAVAA